MNSCGQDEENSLTEEIPEWTMEFVKTFVQTGDLIHRELGGGTMKEMAYALASCGRLQDAFEMWNKIYDIQKEFMEPQHPDILWTREYTSHVLWDLDRHDESISILQDVVDKRNTTFPVDDPHTLSLSENLYFVLMDRGKFQEAAEIKKEIQAKRLTIAYSQNLKFVCDGDDNEGALKLINEIYERGLEFMNSDGNANSSQIVNLLTQGFCTSLNVNMGFWLEMMILIAEILHYKGRHDEAMEVYKGVHDKQMEMLEEDIDQKVVWTMRKMGYVLFDQKKYQKSFEMFKKVYEGGRKIHGENDPEDLLDMENMATALLEQGEYEKSLEMLNKVYEGRLTTFPPGHCAVQIIMSKMAHALRFCGKLQEAFEMRDKIYDIQKKFMESQHPHILWTRAQMSHCLWDLERHDESISILQDVVDIRNTTFLVDDPLTLSLSEELTRRKEIFSSILQQQSLTCLPNENES